MTKYLPEITVTKEELRASYKRMHIRMKEAYGLEHLHFYSKKAGYCCRYISDPNDVDFNDTLKNEDLMFFLRALSMEQGKIWFDDYGQWCYGITELKELYLPMMLGGL